MKDGGETLERRRIYRGKVLTLDLERVELPNGELAALEVVRHAGAAAVVPVLGDDVIFVRQYRHAVGRYLLEIPAGKLDLDEAPAACAARELGEETGHLPGRLEPLGSIWTTPGFCDERIWLYLACDLEPCEQRLERDEVLSLEQHPLERAVEMALSGEIVDGKSACAILRAAPLWRRLTRSA